MKKRSKVTKRFKEEMMQVLTTSVSITALIMSVATFVVIIVMQNNLKKLEAESNITFEYVSTERMSVEEQFARYIDSLPAPEVEITKKNTIVTVQEEKKVQCENADSNELMERVAGIEPVVRTMNTSSYCSCEKCCDKTDGITASGEKVEAWHTIAAGQEYKIGTIIYIPALADEPNGGWFIVQDRGGAIKNGKLDIFLNTHQEALQYGRKFLKCYIYEL